MMNKRPEHGARAALRAKGYMPIPEVAAKIGYSRQGVRLWIDSGTVTAVKLGRNYWIEWNSVVKYFRSVDPEAARLVGI